MCYCAEIRLRVQRHGDVESLRTRGFDPTRKAQLLQQSAQVQRRFAQHFQLTFVSSVGIEIKNADLGLVKVRRTRRPDVNRDAVLVRQPYQRSCVGNNRMIDTAFILRNRDAFQPCRKAIACPRKERTASHSTRERVLACLMSISEEDTPPRARLYFADSSGCALSADSRWCS